MNKDLVLREFLAIERTKMANETTLLAYIRTGLYFLVAGSTLGHIVGTMFWKVAGGPIIFIGLGIVMTGIIRFKKVKKAIEMSKQNIGNSSETFLKSIKGLL
jgi:putative membrane protein